MPRGKKYQKPENITEGTDEEDTVTSELTNQGEELTELARPRKASLSEQKEETLSAQNMANLETILRELREFRRENSETLNEIKEDIKVANTRIDDAERRIEEAEERLQCMEDVSRELLELQKKLEDRLVDQEGRSRRENIRIHGVKEGAEDNAGSMPEFIDKLLREKLELPPTTHLHIERAHRALVSRPPADAPPRSIVVRFMSFRSKEEIIKTAWQKRGFEYEGKRVYLDHDYAPEVLRKRKEYGEAKKVLRERKIRFQTPFPARLRVFYEGETCLYSSAEEATKDMARRGLQVTVVKPTESGLDRIKRLTWQQVSRAKDKSSKETEPGFKQKLQSFKRN